MNIKQLLQPISITALLPWPALRGAEVHDEHENPNQAFGKDANYKLDGDTTFGWKTGTLVGNIDLNGYAFVIDTGEGEPHPARPSHAERSRRIVRWQEQRRCED